MATSSNKISPVKLDIYDKLLGIAKTKFPNFDNYDFIRSGNIGWEMESLAMMIRDGALYKSMLYNEEYLSTAVLPKSIYSAAKEFGVDATMATPASAVILFQIPYDDLSSKLSQATSFDETTYGIKSGTNCVIIDKQNPIIAGEYYFSLEHSIAIVKDSSTSSPVVEYCVNESSVTTTLGDYTNPLITSAVTTYNGTSYLIFTAVTYQYKIKTIERIVTSTSFIASKVYDFDFDDQLAGVSMKYRKGTSSTEDVDLYFNNLESPSDDYTKYAHYTLVDTGTLEVVFASGNAGIPQNGGTLITTLLETKGTTGNITYSGDAVMSITTNENLRDLQVGVSFADGYSFGGTDSPTLDETKQLIINTLSTRNTIITETDLEQFFQNQTQMLSDINGSSVSFVKDRDDILKRSFNAYLLLRNGALTSSSKYSNSVVPTNSIDITYALSGTEQETSLQTTYTSTGITQNDSFSYDSASEKYVNNSGSDTDLSYCVPFYLQVTLYPYKKTHYVYTATDDSAALQMTDMTSLNSILIPTTVGVSKPLDSYDSDYTLSYYVTSDIDLVSAASLDGFVSLIVYTSDSVSFTKTIPTQDVTITKVSDDSSSTGLSQYEISFDLVSASSKPESLFTFLSDGGSVINLKSGSSSGSETSYNSYPSSVKLGLRLKGSVSGSAVDVKMVSSTYLSMFEELDDIMSSDISIDYVTKNDLKYVSSFTVKGVPVVQKRWLSDSDSKSVFIKQLLVYINMLRTNTDKLESNTFFNLKFRNSYGSSYMLNTIRTNIRLALDIHFTSSVTTSMESSYMTEIRRYIRSVVEASNDSEAMKVSDVIAYTKANYDTYIDHIDFNGLNGTFTQYIKHKTVSSTATETTDSVITATDNAKYALEYFNLDETTDSDGVSKIKKDIRFFEYGSTTPISE